MSIEIQIGKKYIRKNNKVYILTENGLVLDGRNYPSFNYQESQKLLKSLGLFTGLVESSLNYAENVIMTSKQGHGFAAEKMNHAWDKMQGKDAEIIGDNNAKNGADRLVDNIQIQTKYCKTGSRCINECFDDNGIMKYINKDGTPMQIEVPSDKFDDAIRSMEDKIRKGKVPGINNPERAKDIVKKGAFTYKQAVNVAKFGNIDSLTYDAINGVKLAGTSMGISSIISFSIAIWNGEKWEQALKNSIYSGLKVGGTVWASSILASQLGRTGFEQALRGTTNRIVDSMGSKTYQFIANGLRGKESKIYGAAAKNYTSKCLRGNIATGVATTIVLSSADFYRLFNGKVSNAQVFKNVTKTSASVAGGTAGWMGGAAAGATAGSFVPFIGTAVGGVVGGLIGSFVVGGVAQKATETVLDKFIEDDAKKMLKIIEEIFSELAIEYLLNEDEAIRVIGQFQTKNIPNELRNMFASNDKKEYAINMIEPIIIGIVKQRPKIQLPTNEEIIDEIDKVIEEISSNEME